VGMAEISPMTIVNWRALALKRLAHLDELKRTGRWQLYFSDEDAIEAALHEAAADADRWKQLAYQSETPEGAAE
jgi:hypothetical protein